MRIAPIFIIVLILVGCARPPEPEPSRKPMSELTGAERCGRLLELSGSIYANPGQRAAMYEMARNEGCMGPPQPQTVIVR